MDDQANALLEQAARIESAVFRAMSDHNGQSLTAREMVRAHAYPVLAAISTLSLVAIAVLQVPQALKAHQFNRSVDSQLQQNGGNGTARGSACN